MRPGGGEGGAGLCLEATDHLDEVLGGDAATTHARVDLHVDAQRCVREQLATRGPGREEWCHAIDSADGQLQARLDRVRDAIGRDRVDHEDRGIDPGSPQGQSLVERRDDELVGAARDGGSCRHLATVSVAVCLHEDAQPRRRRGGAAKDGGIVGEGGEVDLDPGGMSCSTGHARHSREGPRLA